MNSRTKNQLIALVVVALIVVAVAWYLIVRQTYYLSTTLIGIDYAPPSGKPPYLSFTFSQPPDPGQVAGSTASLRGFTVGLSSPTPASAAYPLIMAIQQMPFVPTAGPAPNVLVTNTLPSAASIGGAIPPVPMAITGTGALRFAVPKRA